MTVSGRRGRRPGWMLPVPRENWGDLFFDRLWPEWQRDMGEEWSPSVDFFDKDGKYYLKAEIPGMSKEDVKISLDKGLLTITGKKESKHEEKGENYFLKESSYGSFSRSFRLPGEVEEDKISANLQDGVLTLEMPHKSAPEKKQIDIK